MESGALSLFAMYRDYAIMIPDPAANRSETPKINQARKHSQQRVKNSDRFVRLDLGPDTIMLPTSDPSGKPYIPWWLP